MPVARTWWNHLLSKKQWQNCWEPISRRLQAEASQIKNSGDSVFSLHCHQVNPLNNAEIALHLLGRNRDPSAAGSRDSASRRTR